MRCKSKRLSEGVEFCFSWMPVQGRIQRRIRTLDHTDVRTEAIQQLNGLVSRAKPNQLLDISKCQQFHYWLASALVELLPTLPMPRPNNMLCRLMKDLLQLRYLTNILFHGEPNTCLGHTIQEQNAFIL